MTLFRILACFTMALGLFSPHLQADVTVATIHALNGTNDGALPQAGLVQGTDGFLYGAATRQWGINNGSDNSGFGTIFKVSTNGSFTTLFSFSGTNGHRPSATLLKGADGSFYGTTWHGGTDFQGMNDPWGRGTVFQITTAGVFTVLHHFGTNPPGVQGYPTGKLVQHDNGSLYGTTSGQGLTGSTGLGSIFRITTNGLFTNLVTFANTNGARPFGGLVMGDDGDFYGTTSAGGSSGMGTIFRMSPQGDVTTLFSFAGATGNSPRAALVKGMDGDFYGTTYSGGGFNRGTVFRVTAGGVLTTLFSFAGTNGAFPNRSLIQAQNGILYGTTLGGGKDVGGGGVIFSITTNGFFSKLHTFPGDDRNSSELLSASDENYYGTTSFGPADSNGIVYRFSITDDSPVLSMVVTQPQVVTLSWNAMVGRMYQVQFKTNLTQVNWNNLGGPAMATNSTAVLPDSTGNDSQRFYRISLLP